MNISVFALTKNGAELGERLCRRIDGAYLHLPVRFKGSFNAAFFNDTATTEIYTLSLHDALPIY